MVGAKEENRLEMQSGKKKRASAAWAGKNCGPLVFLKDLSVSPSLFCVFAANRRRDTRDRREVKIYLFSRWTEVGSVREAPRSARRCDTYPS